MPWGLMIAISVLAGTAAGGIVWLVLTYLEHRETRDQAAESAIGAKRDEARSPESKESK